MSATVCIWGGRVEERRLQTAFDTGGRDGGDVCRRQLRCRFQHGGKGGAPFVCRTRPARRFPKSGKDGKTALQEALQARRFALPKYRIEEQIYHADDSMFVISCDLGELGFVCRAKGTSRKAAEQEAAKEALKWLEEKLPLKKKKK